MTIQWGDVVGAYGAVVATGMALLRWFEFRRDRQSVRLTGRVIGHPSLRAEEPPWVMVTATNVGRRAIHLRDLGVLRADGNREAIGSDLGVNPRLEEGQEVKLSPRPQRCSVRTPRRAPCTSRTPTGPRGRCRGGRSVGCAVSTARRRWRRPPRTRRRCSPRRKDLAEMMRKARMTDT